MSSRIFFVATEFGHAVLTPRRHHSGNITGVRLDRRHRRCVNRHRLLSRR